MEQAAQKIMQLTNDLHKTEQALTTAMDKTKLLKQKAQILAKIQDFSGDVFNEGGGEGYNWDLVKNTTRCRTSSS
ncbi:MAG: hypothetical protein HEQ32_08930 [Vampirovibrio sp.]